ncbi:hypothetical protein GCM10023074_60130 [Microbispora amethystogenes]
MEDLAAFWGVLDDQPEEADDRPPAGADDDRPPPEVTASLLHHGDVLWARFENGEARLGSGQRLLVLDGSGEQAGGWRRVEVVDATRLGVRLLQVPWADPPRHVGDDPALLYRPAPPGEVQRVSRVAPFPVGRGPDVQATLAARSKALEEAADERAAQAELHARKQVAEAERRYRQQAAQAETAARIEVDRITREADARVAAARTEVDRITREADARVAAARTEVDRITREADARVAAVRAGVGRIAREADARVAAVSAELEQMRRAAQGAARLPIGVKWMIGVAIVIIVLALLIRLAHT